MAVAFNPEERERITAGLIETGERLFAAQGLKKTSLEELVAPVGIAKGSFYAFFDSKEALYKDVMIRRAPLIGKQLVSALRRPIDQGNLEKLMRQLSKVLTTDPFYSRLLTHPDELRAVARRVGPDQVASVTPHLLDPLLEYFAAGQRDGLVVDDIEPRILVGVLRTVGLLAMNKDLFGDDYEQVLRATITTLARGLTSRKDA